MSLGLYDSRKRRRRRVRWAIVKWGIGLGAVLAAGMVAYESGTTLAQREVAVLSRQIDELTARVEELQRQNTDLRANAMVVEERLAEARQRYERDVPKGQTAALFERLTEKLEAGVKPERLEFLIESAANPRVCDEEPVTKRFLVQTPLYQGANDSVGFAEGALTLTASGESATDPQGRVEAWFDPARPVTLRVTEVGGQTSETTGKLPLHTSVVSGGHEHRFSVVAAETRGFVLVTGDRCDYP